MSSDGHELWVGISDQESEGSYRFTNGQPATNLMFSWGVGEPNDYGGNEDCVYFSRDRNAFNDLNCNGISYGSFMVLCQFPNGNC